MCALSRHSPRWQVPGLLLALGIAPAAALGAGTDPIYQVLRTFETAANPVSGLALGSDNDPTTFYGTTQYGGEYGYGTVFAVKADGSAFSVIYSFDGPNGAYPSGGLLRVLASGHFDHFCGTTQSGGAFGSGTVFQFYPAGFRPTLVGVIHSFSGLDGADPEGGLVQEASNGTSLNNDILGTTLSGGAHGVGTVFRIGSEFFSGQLPPGGWFTTLHDFDNSDPMNGAQPAGGLVQALAGGDYAFYGTTVRGGAYGAGTVFRITIEGFFSVSHSFNYTDGAYPQGHLVEGDRDHILYGTTAYGGANGSGTVFKVSCCSLGYFFVLHNFAGTDGAVPLAGLVQDSNTLGSFDPVFYGTTAYGTASNFGTVFTVDGLGNFSVVHTFDNTSGANPFAGLVQGSDGAFYGTTEHGNISGTVFKVSADGSAFSVLHSFDSGGNGAVPSAGLIQGSDGAFYGTTQYGGAAGGYGTVSKVSADGSGFAVLHSFDYTNGSYPQAGVVQGSDGAFYGTTLAGGTSTFGTVFKVSADGSSFSVIHSLDYAISRLPLGGLVQGSDGAFYGTTSGGGTAGGYGTVFKVSADGSVFSVIHSFDSTDGSTPQASLVQGSDGTLYGTTSSGGGGGVGTVFKISTDGSGFGVMRTFGGTSGSTPQASLVQGSDGAFYGTTSGGGTHGFGAVFKVSADGSSFSVIHSFGGTDGSTPQASLLQGSDGAFYGTTSHGGVYGFGTVFKVLANGSSFSVIHSFDYGTGGYPRGGLVQGLDGALYGTTQSGGPAGGGVLFRLGGAEFQFSPATYSVAETAGKATITVVRNGAAPGTAMVSFATSDGSAQAGVNYTATSGTLIFTPGIVSHSFTVPIINGSVAGSKTVLLALANPSGGPILGSQNTAVLTITGEGVAFSAATYSVSQLVGKATISVKRGGPATTTVTVAYATSDGTAKAGVHYTATSGTLTFKPGVTLQSFAIPVANLTTDEGSLTVNLALSSPGGGAALGSPSAAVLTIANTNVAGTVQFSAASYAVMATAGHATITVTRTGGGASGVTVNFATSDGTATAGTDYTATSGTLAFGAGVTSQSFTVTVANNSAKGNKTVNLALSSPGGGAALGKLMVAILTIQTVATQMTFSAANYTVSEIGKIATITVSRRGPLIGTVGVTYATSDGTASAPGDYAPASGVLTFGPGVASKTFTVTVNDDALLEGTETVNLSLSNPTGLAFLGVQSTALLTIVTDNPSLQFTSTGYGVSELAGNATVTVTRTGPPTSAVSVDFATSDGTAQSGLDYTPTAGTLSFASGVVSKTFTVPIIHDTAQEGPRTVNLTLLNPQNGALLGTPASAVLTITDVDKGGMLQFATSDFTASDTGQPVTITVTRTNGSASGVSVNYATSDGTGVAGTNYLASSGTLDFAQGQTSATFAVTLLDDSLSNGTKTVNLSLSGPTGGGTLGAQSAATLSIVENR
jgi:uncharacterized repeat protein (TIGR03803 family)